MSPFQLYYRPNGKKEGNYAFYADGDGGKVFTVSITEERHNRCFEDFRTNIKPIFATTTEVEVTFLKPEEVPPQVICKWLSVTGDKQYGPIFPCASASNW